MVLLLKPDPSISCLELTLADAGLLRGHYQLASQPCIAEVVSRFDVVAIQEVRRSAQAFLGMMQVLGDGWAFLVTDVTLGAQGNSEYSLARF
jgi:hypothetical protein